MSWVFFFFFKKDGLSYLGQYSINTQLNLNSDSVSFWPNVNVIFYCWIQSCEQIEFMNDMHILCGFASHIHIFLKK